MGSDSSGYLISPNVSVKSETSDTYMPVGSSSIPQGGTLPSSAYGLMPTGQTVSKATGTLSQSQDGSIPSNVQGLMTPHQTPSSYSCVSGFPS